MLRNWLSTLRSKSGRWAFQRVCRARRRKQRFCLACLESLEDRILLSHTPLILGNGTEPFVAVDPHNPDNVVVGSNNFGAVFSTDGGESFSAASSPAGYRGDSGLAIDSQGRVFSSYLTTDPAEPTPFVGTDILDVQVSNGTFAGQTLSSPGVTISNTPADDDKELIAADYFDNSPFRDNVYVAWRGFGPAQVLYSRSINNGATFSAPVAVALPFGGATFTSGAQPKVGPNGEVYILYWQGANIGGDVGELRLLKSTDGGVTFPINVLVSGAMGTVGTDATGLDHNAGLMRNQLPNQSFRRDARTEIDLAVDPLRAGHLYAIWSTDPDGTIAGDAANVMYASSIDGGLTWSAPIVLNDDGGTLSQFQPSIASDEDGNLVAIWYDERLSTNQSDPTLSIFARVSRDGGNTWSSSFLVSGSGFDPDSGGATTFIGDYIRVAAADGRAFAAWTQTNGTGTNQIAFETFSLLAPFPDQYESNDTQSHATILGSLQKVTLQNLTIHNTTDVDFFKYTAEDTGKLIVNEFFDANQGPLSLRIRDDLGNIIANGVQTQIRPGLDVDQITIPVVARQEYYLEVFSPGRDINEYDLEIENIPAPVPTKVTLDESDDSGSSFLDNVTFRTVSLHYFINADLNDFANEGITILTAAQAAAGVTPGAAIQVFDDGVSVGFANVVAGTNNTIFEIDFDANLTLFPINGPNAAGPLGYQGFHNIITASVTIFDPQENAAGNPAPQNGRTQFSVPLIVTADNTAPVAPINLDLLTSSDSSGCPGSSDTDNITNINAPAFSGLGETNAIVRIFANGIEVGIGRVGTDATDGVLGNGLGTWEVTVEPLTDGVYDISARLEDLAGNIGPFSAVLMVTIDTRPPQRPTIDLADISDSGRNNKDNVTNDLNTLLPGFLRFRVTSDPGTWVIIKDGNTVIDGPFLMPAAGFVFRDVPAAMFPTDRDYILSAEANDIACNMTQSEGLIIEVDRTAPAAPTITIDPATSDTGVDGFPLTLVDNITSDTTTGFFGTAEADSIVRVFGNANPLGLTVAIPLNGNQAFPNGEWDILPNLDFNDPIFGVRDGLRIILATAEDLAGNVGQPGQLNIFIDTQGPQVFDPDAAGPQQAIQVVTKGVVNPTYDLFDVKPSIGPTPRVDGLLINVQDNPDRIAAPFDYEAVLSGAATNPGYYQVKGDRVGIVAVTSVVVVNNPSMMGQPATATIRLNFAEPLEDDRFTLTIFDSLTDRAGNGFDGESNASQPLGTPTFPSGNAIAGGDFVARFTVDSRPEPGVHGQVGVTVDANGNFILDPTVTGGVNIDITRDLVFQFGLQTDAVFAGQFHPNGGVSNGFDRLGAYGLVNGKYRFLLDFNDDGVPDVTIVSNVQVNALPLAGDFNNDGLGDEIGLFDGVTWWLDTNGDNVLDAPFSGNMRGLPFAGDFDGDGLTDLGTYIANTNSFQFDLAWDGIDGNADQGFGFGFPGVLERPFAGDFNLDGVDDVGLTTPSQTGTDGPLEWSILISKGDPIVGTVNTLDHPFSPTPDGSDFAGHFGSGQQVPVVGNFDPPLSVPPADIGGQYVFNGQATSVTQSGTSLTFTNEHGSKANGRFLNSTQVIADGWGGLVGDLVNGNIVWKNGTVWSSTAAAATSIGGQYTFDGQTTTVEESGSVLTFINEHGGQSQGHYLNATQVVATNWGNLVGNLVNGNIHWTNGTVWTFTAPAAQEIPVVGGTYTFNGQFTSIQQVGSTLVFTNEHGGTSQGEFLSPTQVVATQWGGLVGNVVGNQIVWTNGTIWTLFAPIISGEYTNGGKSAFVEQSGNDLTFINENGGTSRGRFLNASQVVASDWGNLTGIVINGRIEWANGSRWESVVFDSLFAAFDDWYLVA
jgi:Bacterial Ig-like domain